MSHVTADEPAVVAARAEHLAAKGAVAYAAPAVHAAHVAAPAVAHAAAPAVHAAYAAAPAVHAAYAAPAVAHAAHVAAPAAAYAAVPAVPAAPAHYGLVAHPNGGRYHRNIITSILSLSVSAAVVPVDEPAVASARAAHLAALAQAGH